LGGGVWGWVVEEWGGGSLAIIEDLDVRIDRPQDGVVSHVGADTSIVNAGAVDVPVNERPTVEVPAVDEEADQAVLPFQPHVVGLALIPSERTGCRVVFELVHSLEHVAFLGWMVRH
jgi:hypothetical protein